MITAEKFNLNLTEDYLKYYPILSKWWRLWNWTEILPKFLPTNGIIIKYKDEYVFAGFLYSTDSSMSIIDFIVSSKKKYEGDIRKQCLIKLIKTLEGLSISLGFKAIFTCASSKEANLVNNLLELGYGEGSKGGKGDQNMITFIKKI